MMIAARSIALHGAYYDNNFGDLLLLKIFENWLRREHSGAIQYPYVPEHEKERFASLFPMSDISTRARWDAMVLCGGGHFADPGTSGRFLLGYFEKRFLRESIMPEMVSNWRGAPYAIVGVEVGPLANHIARLAAKRIFSKASEVSVRNDEAAAFLRDELNVRRGVIVAPDPAVTISSEDVPQRAHDHIAHIVKPYLGSILLGIHHPRDFLTNDSGATAVRAAIIEAVQTNRDVTPVIFSDIGHGDPSMYLSRLADYISSETGQKCLRVPFQGMWETLALLDRLDAVITTKLHVGVAAYAMGTHCESIAYHPKTQRFYRSTNRTEYTTNLAAMSKDEAMRRVGRAIETGRIKPNLKDATWKRIREEADVHRQLMTDFIQRV